MQDSEKRNEIAQWAFDTRPILLRFHLWLEDVEVEWEQGIPSLEYTFVPRGIRRCLAMASAATALGTKVFGGFGEARPGATTKAHMNQVKKAADAISSYVLSEGLWYTTRRLPENHAIMVCLGEGLMPKAGETPEMGANPLLGFGRVYARPEVAHFVDAEVRRLLNEPGRSWEEFYQAVKLRGITIWGAAVDTLENTTRFAQGKDTGPMSVLHLFDQPLNVIRSYESYMGSLSVPREVARMAEEQSVLLDFLTPRHKVVAAIEATYPGIRREHIHVWTLSGPSRAARLDRLWHVWRELGVHLVEDGWQTPAGVAAFTDSGTYAPTFMIGSWTDQAGAVHVFLCDGYAASAEAMQAASLSEVLDVDVSMALYSPIFKLPYDDEYRLMKLLPDAPDFRQQLNELFGQPVDDGRAAQLAAAIREAYEAHIPVQRRVLRADDFFPEKDWRVLATAGYMCTDPYTGAEGVTRLDDSHYRVTTRLATRKTSIRITFTFRLMESFEQSRLVFSPLLVRFTSGADYRTRPVKISDSGRIRNEIQTMLFQGLEYEGESIRVHFDRVDDDVVAPDKKEAIREILRWYKQHHPAWFGWLQVE